MRYRDLPSYRRCLGGVREGARLEAIHEAVSGLLGCLERRRAPPVGLGLKPLRPPLWEIRASGEDRVVFSWDGDVVTLLLVGSCGGVRRIDRRR